MPAPSPLQLEPEIARTIVEIPSTGSRRTSRARGNSGRSKVTRYFST